ncbi:MFS general substrate transporter [Stipitochalara longipes BDJ]|nr:MFS general substrate transporter [Stipitochalara longipes BDJ]
MPDNEELNPVITTPSSERPRSFFARNSVSNGHNAGEEEDVEESEEEKGQPPTKWSMGVLNDRSTNEVPGSVLLLTGQRNEPLGLRNAPARTSASSLPQQPAVQRRVSRASQAAKNKKTTKDGAIILEPQPDDSINDPLNWPTLRRDAALFSLGLYCMVGGGMTPILAAGFTNVAATYNVATAKVALTTGLYMMGLGVGSVIFSPTAILFGKRPVYLFSAILFICTSVWCAASPSYNSLLIARIFQGISVSPVECLPSATVAEIFFLHERAYRLGIYTLLLLGGKNLVPLVSAAIIQSLGWRWVFWIVAMVVGFCGVLLFLFVPESYWDRTPIPKSRKQSKNGSRFSLFSFYRESHAEHNIMTVGQVDSNVGHANLEKTATLGSAKGALPKRPDPAHRSISTRHVGFAPEENRQVSEDDAADHGSPMSEGATNPLAIGLPVVNGTLAEASYSFHDRATPTNGPSPLPNLHNSNSPWQEDVEKVSNDYANSRAQEKNEINNDGGSSYPLEPRPPVPVYTNSLRNRPQLTFVQTLKPYNGRLHNDKWFRVAVRPFILYAYPAVLWSAVVYSCSVGWLIVLSESVAVIYRTRTTYGFSALSTGLIYISPFIGGILGTAVAGKVSDIIVQAMSKRNGGLYEPEFRLVMAIPITISTVIGLMGFGWSAHEHDAWIVPTIFFGIISFGCSLGSTTAITFCVDSYRQYAGEALVTLNFSKNIFHGLVFSLFFTKWLESDGSKTVFIYVGVIQLILMTFSIPMYIFGKRARMWTVRKNLMEKF